MCTVVWIHRLIYNVIVLSQLHKFLTAVAPIRAVAHVGGAAAQLLSTPAEHFFVHSPAAAGPWRMLGLQQEQKEGPGDGRGLSWQLQRAVVRFVQALASEALGLGATVVAGANYLLGQAGR